jgi:drug/metabolite transporter (DMT)-like permease
MNGTRVARLGPAAAAVAAAVLFGAGVPVAKVFAGKVDPVPMAALLYLGSGGGLFLLQGISALTGGRSREAGIARADLPWLAGATLAGGVLAPIALMAGLRHSPAATASLLLNLEGAATAVLAAIFFREHLGGRTWAAVLLVTGAGMALSWNPGGRIMLAPAALLVVAACVLWGVDNNLSRHISGKDPVAIAAVKGLVAGSFSLVLTLLPGAPLPDIRTSLLAMALGFASYGVSIALFIYAMRGLGAARTGALFATAPFIGTALSFVMFRARPGLQFFIALPLMVVGAALLLGEHHAHRHVHASLEHEHRHGHDDEHHDHTHRPEEEAIEHSHRHVHEPVEHDHPHTPDEHHRHGHG